MVEQIFRHAKNLLDTRSVFHKTDAAICAHVFCSFLAIVLQRELRNRMGKAGIEAGCNDVLRGLGASATGCGTPEPGRAGPHRQDRDPGPSGPAAGWTPLRSASVPAEAACRRPRIVWPHQRNASSLPRSGRLKGLGRTLPVQERAKGSGVSTGFGGSVVSLFGGTRAASSSFTPDAFTTQASSSARFMSLAFSHLTAQEKAFPPNSREHSRVRMGSSRSLNGVRCPPTETGG